MKEFFMLQGIFLGISLGLTIGYIIGKVSAQTHVINQRFDDREVARQDTEYAIKISYHEGYQRGFTDAKEMGLGFGDPPIMLN